MEEFPHKNIAVGNSSSTLKKEVIPENSMFKLQISLLLKSPFMPFALTPVKKKIRNMPLLRQSKRHEVGALDSEVLGDALVFFRGIIFVLFSVHTEVECNNISLDYVRIPPPLQ